VRQQAEGVPGRILAATATGGREAKKLRWVVGGRGREGGGVRCERCGCAKRADKENDVLIIFKKFFSSVHDLITLPARCGVQSARGIPCRYEPDPARAGILDKRVHLSGP
jgi:hypothetical protein